MVTQGPATIDVLREILGAPPGPATIDVLRGDREPPVHDHDHGQEDGPDGRASLPAIPVYPLAALDGPLAGLVASSSLPDALLGAGGLAVLAALCGNAEVELPGGDTERPALWVAAIAPTGGAKSPSLERRAMAPLFDLDALARQHFDQQLAGWRAADRDQRGERPPDPSLISGSITLEAQARLLAGRQAYGACGLVFADELDSYLSAIGEYKRASGDRAKVMELWNARSWLVQRVGNARDPAELGVNIFIPRTCVSILGGLQPHLHQMLGDEASGMRARWLPHYSDLQSVPWDEWTPEGRADWAAAVTRMHGDKGRPRRWEFSENAKAAWREAQDRWKAADAAEVSASAKAALKKADLQAARVALVLAESVSTEPRHRNVIPGTAMRGAVAITDYCLGVFRALPSAERFALSYRDERLSDAVARLLAAVEARPDRRMTARQLLHGHVAGVRNADQLKVLLAEYRREFPGCVRDEQTATRKTTMVYAPVRS